MPYLLAVFLYTAFFFISGVPSLFDGMPFDTLPEQAALVIAIPFFLFLSTPRMRVSRLHWLAVPLIIMKITIGWVALEEGLAGSYYYPDAVGALERSTEFPHAPYHATRLDRRIDFTAAGYVKNIQPFPLWFFNDNTRFNATATEKTVMPFTVTWKGYLYVPKKDMVIGIVSDGATSVHAIMPNKEAVIPITITYAASAKPDRHIRLFWNDRNATPVKESLYPLPYSVRQVHNQYFLKIMDTGIAFAILALLIFLALEAGRRGEKAIQLLFSWRSWLFISGVSGILFFTALLMREGIHPYFNFLGGGNDPLTYETYARYIQFTHNWSMAAIEKGSYYYQPYYYFLTIFHYLAGEGLFYVFLMQGALLAGAGLCLAEAGRRMTRSTLSLKTLWPLILIAPCLAIIPQTASEAGMLFPSTLGIFFASLTAFFLMRGRDANGKNEQSIFFTFAGVALGLGILNRFNFLSWVPFIALWIMLSSKRRLPSIILFFLGLMFIMGPVLTRNKAVSGYIQIFSRSNATINFIKAAPQAALDYTPRDNHPWLNDLSMRLFDGRAKSIIPWIMENPAAYVNHIARKTKETALWLAWPLMLFIIASLLYLFRPHLFMPNTRRRDYLLLGIFPFIQIATVILLSDNSTRYHLPALAFMILWSALLCVMLQNALVIAYQALSIRKK